jgi:hypothetical protein
LSAQRVAVVVPLRQGARVEVEDLVAGGPPFDPDEAGLERHEVFLSDEEAVFVFGLVSSSALRELVRDSSVWLAAGAWDDYVAGPARIARPSYTWEVPPAEPENVFFDPTPGPGDSDGGDVYPP